MSEKPKKVREIEWYSPSGEKYIHRDYSDGSRDLIITGRQYDAPGGEKGHAHIGFDEKGNVKFIRGRKVFETDAYR